MSDLYEPDNAIAFYRSTDPIKNLKIKIELERITSAISIPHSMTELSGDNEDNNTKDSHLPHIAGERDVEIFTFQWQQKVFCEEEYTFYNVESNCETVLQNKYHDECQKLEQEGGRPTKRLFSYISNDNYVNRHRIEKVTNRPNEVETALAQKMRGIRHRRIAPVSRLANNNNRNRSTYLIPTGLVSSDLVNYDPSPDERNRIHLMPASSQHMFIMADIGVNTGKTVIKDEVVICEINIDEHGILSIRPDFNKGKKAYQVEQKSCRDLYEYTLEHVSTPISNEELDTEQKMYKELYSRHATYLSECVGREFYMPEENIMSYTIFGEINSAINFEYDDTYVTYYIDLPEGWYAKDINSLHGVTQACKSKAVNRDNVSNFCFTFNVSLEYNEKFLEDNRECGQVIKYPDLFVEVKSLDNWGRCRLEGYGYIILPNSAGLTSVDINCWRPMNGSCTSQLRRFFIGGNPQLDDPINACKPHYFKEKYLSKLGMLTESTGTVSLNLNIMKQSQKYMREMSVDATSNASYDKLYDLNTNVNIALDAFQQAKQRMISARNNLHTEYIDTMQMMDIGKAD